MELETIGENAGKVWRTLNEMRGEISIQELSRKISLSAEDVALAVGWLAMKTVNCFELYPSILGAKRVNELLLELFPYMHTALSDDEGLDIYITKEEYVFVLNELSKLNNYALTMPDSIEETNTTLTSMPIECAIVERCIV